MTAAPTLKRIAPPTVGMDFWQLRREGLDYIIRLGSDFWTDYNLHDPGITMLEVLCFAITDLSYRANLPIGDLLATETGSVAPKGMPLAPDMLTCNPVTFDDFRKLLIDIDGVKNAWVRKATVPPKNTEGWVRFGIETKDIDENLVKVSKRFLSKPTNPNTPTSPIPLNGLYEMLIDFDDQTDCCPPAEALEKVRAVLQNYRNLCEDYVHIGVVETIDINICALIDIEEDTDVNDIAAKIYFQLQEFMTPTIPFYNLSQLLERKKTASFDAIFEGVLLQNGFIDDSDLVASDLKQKLHISDFYNILGDIEGVKAVKGIKARKEKDKNIAATHGWEEWTVILFDSKETPVKPMLSAEGSGIAFRKRGQPILVNKAIVAEKLAQLRMMNTPLSMKGKNGITYPTVTARKDLTDYFTIQNEFPHVYHVGKEGIEKTETPLRKAQVKQLKGFLTFFDQILTNYLGYLANVKNVLSIEQAADLPTRFSQNLYDVPFIEDLMFDYGAISNRSKTYDDFLKNGLESESEAAFQKNIVLNHLIARFAETFSDYAMTRYYDDPNVEGIDNYLLRIEQNQAEKVRFLNQIPVIQRERGKGFDYQKMTQNNPDVWDTNNVEGLKKRVSALLGIPNATRHTLTCPPSYDIINFTKPVTDKRRALSFFIADAGKKPLLEAFMPQTTDERRRLLQKETIDALMQDVLFKNLPKVKPLTQTLKPNISELTTADDIEINAEKTVIRFGKDLNNRIFLQKDGELWRFMVANSEEKILVQSASPYKTVADAYAYLVELQAALFGNNCDSEGFHIVEHILLRPRCEDCLDGSKQAIDLRKCLNSKKIETPNPHFEPDIADPYSFWITVVASTQWQRFKHPTNQAYFEQTVRAETPAHIGVRVCWLTNNQMYDFETAYGTWLIELAQHAPDRCAVDEAAHNLVLILNDLACHCCDNEEADDTLTCE